jgi:hypothetical protein
VVFTAVRQLRPWRDEPFTQDVNERLPTLMAMAVDLVICGSVAMNREGARVEGRRLFRLGGRVPTAGRRATAKHGAGPTVHPLQVVDEPLPETIHDFRVDLVVTPDEVIGAASRGGHLASSGSICTGTRLPRFRLWLSWQPDV